MNKAILNKLSWQLILAFLGVSLLAACAAPQPPDKLSLAPVNFSDLPGWNEDHVSEAVPALVQTCNLKMRQPIAGKPGPWYKNCQELAKLPLQDDVAARAFFENHYQPYAVSSPDGDDGLFTGYYEAELHGSWKRDQQHQTPLYARPRDLITADLGDWKPEWKGQHITGKVMDGKLKLYDDRTAIEQHPLKRRAKVLLWVDNPVDAFFLAIQGSGRVIMKNGEVVQIGYDIQNGRSYVPIGRVMAEEGDIPKPVTMQKIRAWLSEHPMRAQEIMDKNPSYVFFRILKGDGPIGAEGAPLTPRRSLAVDPAFVPLGTALWLDTQDGMGTPLQRLMIAQDTGGAIKGAVRGDFFWGYGPSAEEQAGVMQSKGRYYLFLPQQINN